MRPGCLGRLPGHPFQTPHEAGRERDVRRPAPKADAGRPTVPVVMRTTAGTMPPRPDMVAVGMPTPRFSGESDLASRRSMRAATCVRPSMGVSTRRRRPSGMTPTCSRRASTIPRRARAFRPDLLGATSVGGPEDPPAVPHPSGPLPRPRPDRVTAGGSGLPTIARVMCAEMRIGTAVRNRGPTGNPTRGAFMPAGKSQHVRPAP